MRVGIHCHNDAECGVANTLAAVEAGARQVQGTMNGVGERTGNANLVSIIANLQLKLGHEVLAPERLAPPDRGRALRRRAAQPQPRPATSPTSGKNAFAHKGGLHVAGVRADAATFEHVDPAVVGNRRELLVSELAGRSTVPGEAPPTRASTSTRATSVAARRARQGSSSTRGFQFEAADASFELLVRKETGDYEPLFRLESWRVIVEKRADGRVETEATIKLWIDGERYVRTAEGNGPVHALDRALRAAITTTHPHLAEIELVNFKVRILDETKGSDAVIRVAVDASDGADVWGSMGVSTNLIEASWHALVDSLEYGMQPAAARALRPRSGPMTGSRAPTRSRSPGRSWASDGGARGARGAALGPAVARPARAGLRAGVRRAPGRRARQRRLERHGRPAPRAARGGRDATATRW